MVADSTRTFTTRGVSVPTRRTIPSLSTRRSLACRGKGISPTSSKKTVPPSADSMSPGFADTAPENALPRGHRHAAHAGAVGTPEVLKLRVFAQVQARVPARDRAVVDAVVALLAPPDDDLAPRGQREQQGPAGGHDP